MRSRRALIFLAVLDKLFTAFQGKLALSTSTSYTTLMFKDSQSYNKAVKRVIQLQELEKEAPLSQNDVYELETLMDAVMVYEDTMDAEARAEYEFMQEFEDRFLAANGY